MYFSREEGIRTLDSNTIGIHTFQACAFDRSATSLFKNQIKEKLYPKKNYFLILKLSILKTSIAFFVVKLANSSLEH